MTRLPCCIEVDGDYAPKARYALEMLLLPLGVGPVWVGRSSLTGPSLYYGTQVDELPDDTVSLAVGTDAEAYYSQRTPLNLDDVLWKRWNDTHYPMLFSSDGESDWVASAYFWLSGWQEYVTTERDVHGRFPHAASVQHALGTTELPVVEIYRQRLLECLRTAGIPARNGDWGGASWVLCPTIDVDYLRKWRKGIYYRELVEYFLLNQRRASVTRRFERLWHGTRQSLKRGDPFRTALDRMLASITSTGTGTLLLKAGAHGPRDVHYDLNSRYLQRLIAQCLASGVEIGLHPSYHAHTHPEYMRRERANLSELMGAAPVSARQHYLRFDSPSTHRLQFASGFRIDSTLGFATHAGFRNGTCMPFRIYDAQANRSTDMWEMPLVVMDSALFNRQLLGPEEAIATTKNVLGQCAKFGGVGVVLWHNVLWDELDYPGWGHHFDSIMQWGRASGARIMSLQNALESWLGYRLGTQPTVPM